MEVPAAGDPEATKKAERAAKLKDVRIKAAALKEQKEKKLTSLEAASVPDSTEAPDDGRGETMGDTFTGTFGSLQRSASMAWDSVARDTSMGRGQPAAPAIPVEAAAPVSPGVFFPVLGDSVGKTMRRASSQAPEMAAVSETEGGPEERSGGGGDGPASPLGLFTRSASMAWDSVARDTSMARSDGRAVAPAPATRVEAAVPAVLPASPSGFFSGLGNSVGKTVRRTASFVVEEEEGDNGAPRKGESNPLPPPRAPHPS
jgi:hypothetical protein